MFSDMGQFDRLKACPIIEGSPLQWSVGYYRGRHRVTFAWFADFDSAYCYLRDISCSYPHLRLDVLKSLF